LNTYNIIRVYSVVNELIAILEDEPDIRNLVVMHLERSGYRTEGFGTGEELFEFLEDAQPDLLVLDLMLPDTDGLEVCKKIRNSSSTRTIPVIMLTAKGEESDRIVGLELGADDYVTKPFSPGELVARVKAVLRRPALKSEESEVLDIDGNVLLDKKKYEVTVNGQTAGLTTTEFRILDLLLSRRGWIYSRDQILEKLWGNDRAVTDRTIDVHIRNLRRKLGKAGEYIQNQRGMGYKITDEKIDIS
jgi:two-component system phosphate regulon response regulator PhoB/two-component system alkaline phosphatase synthesis response regulator PhoP